MLYEIITNNCKLYKIYWKMITPMPLFQPSTHPNPLTTFADWGRQTGQLCRTTAPAHKNEDDEFRRQKWRRNFSKDLSGETAVCELRGQSRQGQKNVHRVRELRTPQLKLLGKNHGKTHLKSAQKGNDKGKSKQFDRCTTDELHALPSSLCQEILQVCENTLR